MSPNRFRNAVGENIREKRLSLGWTQDVFAAKLQRAGLSNFDRVTVAKIESQIRSVFDYELALIAHVLKTPCDTLLASPANIKAVLPRLIRSGSN